jgi:hypothetical protein
MIDDPHVGPGEKYALIGFRIIRPIGMDPVHLGAGLWACGRLPFALDGNWKEWIGTVREQAIRHANLFLLAKMRSSQVEIRDGENEKLKNQVFRLYQALLLSASVRVFDAVFLLTGAHRESGPEVRELMEPPAPLSIAGATADAVTPAILRLADRSVIAIAELEAIGGFQRIGRMYSIYQRALDNPDHVERLHQFCRCIEGLILPDISRTTTQFPQAGGGATQRRRDGEAGDRGQEHVFDPEAAGEPAGQRHHDGAAHDIGGQRPGNLVERSRQAALDVRQGDIEDRVIEALHDVRQHDRERDHAAVWDRGERLPPHRRGSQGGIIPAASVSPALSLRGLTRGSRDEDWGHVRSDRAMAHPTPLSSGPEVTCGEC